MLNREKNWSNSSETRNERNLSTIPHFFKFMLKNLAGEIKKKGILIRKEEMKPSLFTDDMILYIGDTKMFLSENI